MWNYFEVVFWKRSYFWTKKFTLRKTFHRGKEENLFEWISFFLCYEAIVPWEKNKAWENAALTCWLLSFILTYFDTFLIQCAYFSWRVLYWDYWNWILTTFWWKHFWALNPQAWDPYQIRPVHLSRFSLCFRPSKNGETSEKPKHVNMMRPTVLWSWRKRL